MTRPSGESRLAVDSSSRGGDTREALILRNMDWHKSEKGGKVMKHQQTETFEKLIAEVIRDRCSENEVAYDALGKLISEKHPTQSEMKVLTNFLTEMGSLSPASIPELADVELLYPPSCEFYHRATYPDRETIEEWQKLISDWIAERKKRGWFSDPPAFPLYLGKDSTIRFANDGGASHECEQRGAIINDSHDHTGLQEVTAVTLGMVVGKGKAEAWVGYAFKAKGAKGESASAKIAMDVTGSGQMMAVGVGVSDVLIEMRVKDHTTGSLETMKIFEDNATGPYTFNNRNQDDFDAKTPAITTILSDGHRYGVYLYLRTQAQFFSEGGASADWGPEDGDDGGHGVRYSQISFEFTN